MDKQKLEEVFKKIDWRKYKEYLKRRYTVDHARHIYSYSRRYAKQLRNKGVSLKLMRKVHKAVLSSSMNDSEIDLLQGRLSKIIVRHYTREILIIAEKYYKAYKPYLGILRYLKGIYCKDSDLNSSGIKIAGGGFEPPQQTPTYLIFYREEEHG